MTDTRTRRWSKLLILVGVLAWVPYFYLLASGAEPSLLPFLAIHLAGVIPGAWLRVRSMPASERKFGAGRRTAANVLVVLGVLAWVPYFYLTRVAQADVALTPFLIAHLTGVLGGSALRISVEVQRVRNRQQAAKDEPPPG